MLFNAGGLLGNGYTRRRIKIRAKSCFGRRGFTNTLLIALLTRNDVDDTLQARHDAKLHARLA